MIVWRALLYNKYYAYTWTDMVYTVSHFWNNWVKGEPILMIIGKLAQNPEQIWHVRLWNCPRYWKMSTHYLVNAYLFHLIEIMQFPSKMDGFENSRWLCCYMLHSNNEFQASDITGTVAGDHAPFVKRHSFVFPIINRFVQQDALSPCLKERGNFG